MNIDISGITAYLTSPLGDTGIPIGFVVLILLVLLWYGSKKRL